MKILGMYHNPHHHHKPIRVCRNSGLEQCQGELVPYKLRVFKKLLSHDIFRPVLRGGVLIYAKKV